MKGALKISLIYLSISMLWILTSDRIVFLISSQAESIIHYSMIKGLVFVMITSVFIYLLAYGEIEKRNRLIRLLNAELDVKKHLVKELHHRILNNLQVIMSLFNSAESAGFSEKIRKRFVSRLYSMKSVFLIVYNTDDLTNISLSSVIYEYCKERPEKYSFIREISYQDQKINVEHIVTIMIVIDVLSDLFTENGPVSIRLRGGNLVELSSDGSASESALSPEETGMLEMLLKSTGVQVAWDAGQKSVSLSLPVKSDFHA